MEKVPFPIDKRKWSPSPSPGGIVLVSTYSDKGKPHFAPKSWVQMVSFAPPILIFSGTKGNETENNVLKSREFVLNLVDERLAKAAYASIQWRGTERVQNTNFTFRPAEKVNAPWINECKAHLECRLLDTKEVGSGFLMFGEIVAAAIWKEIINETDTAKRYQLFRQAVFQENGIFSVIDSINMVK